VTRALAWRSSATARPASRSCCSTSRTRASATLHFSYGNVGHARTAGFDASASTIKLEILKYYDTAGTSGWFTLHWAPL
jgi:hypothetical protein